MLNTFNEYNVGADDAKILLLSFLMTDGSVSYIKKRKHYLIRIYGYDKSIHDIFVLFAKKGFGIEKPTWYFASYGNTVNATCYQRWAKTEIVKTLFQLSPSFRKKPNKNESIKDFLALSKPTIKSVMDCSREVRKLFFRIAMSCDGYITLLYGRKPRLGLACAHPKLALEWQKLAESIGLEFKIEKDRYTWSGIHGLETANIATIEKFHGMGGFYPEDVKVCRSKKYKGYKKNDILLKGIEI